MFNEDRMLTFKEYIDDEETIDESTFQRMFTGIANLPSRKELNVILSYWKKHVDKTGTRDLGDFARIAQTMTRKIGPAKARDAVAKMVKNGSLDKKYMWESVDS